MGCGADVGLRARRARAERGGSGATSPLCRYLACRRARRTTHRLVQVAASNGLVRACAGAASPRDATHRPDAPRTALRRGYAADAHAPTPDTRRRLLGLILFALAVVGALFGVASSCARSRQIPWRMPGPTTRWARASTPASRSTRQGPTRTRPSPTDTHRSSPLPSAPSLLCRSRRPPHLGGHRRRLVPRHALAARRPSTGDVAGRRHPGVPIGFTLAVAQAHALVTWLLTIGHRSGSPWPPTSSSSPPRRGLVRRRRDWRRVRAWRPGWPAFAVLQLSSSLRRRSTSWAPARWSRWETQQLLALRHLTGALGRAPRWWRSARPASGSTRWGWAAAVGLATLAPPRLPIYMFMGLLAALRLDRFAAVEGRLEPFATRPPSP